MSVTGSNEEPLEVGGWNPTDDEQHSSLDNWMYWAAKNPSGDEHHASLDNWVDYVAKHSTDGIHTSDAINPTTGGSPQ